MYSCNCTRGTLQLKNGTVEECACAVNARSSLSGEAGALADAMCGDGAICVWGSTGSLFLMRIYHMRRVCVWLRATSARTTCVFVVVGGFVNAHKATLL